MKIVLCRDCALRRVDLGSARRCPWSADAGLEADIEPRESGSARRRSPRNTPSVCQGANPKKMNRGLGPPFVCSPSVDMERLRDRNR
jgi:hypothetical protein